MIYLISDTHFNHKKIIEYCNRPFSSVEEMNEKIIENWNKTIKSNEDEIWHLGDFCFGNPYPILQKLRGTIRLIKGNHDRIIKKFLEPYVHPYKLLQIKNKTVMFVHIPTAYKVDYIIHGHTHQYNMEDKKFFNVSVENINYMPISLEEVIKEKLGI